MAFYNVFLEFTEPPASRPSKNDTDVEQKQTLKDTSCLTNLIAVHVRVDSPPLLFTPYFFQKDNKELFTIEPPATCPWKKNQNKTKQRKKQKQTANRSSWWTTPYPPLS